MTEVVTVTGDLLRGWPLPEPGSEKHQRGVVLVVGGSASTPGAVLLAGEAALRAGAGQLKLATVASTAAALGSAVPEARVHGLAETEAGDLAPHEADRIVALSEEADATLVGVGLVDPDHARDLVGDLRTRLSGPVVLDALGTAGVGRGASGAVLLTVNPNELAHLLGVDEIEGDDLARCATEAATRTGSVVLLGADTKYVAAPDGATYMIAEGGPGLAVSGSGDVQAGLATGLLARGADPVQAAVWAAWLHAAAGDRLAERGRLGFLARELAAEVPGLLTRLQD